MSESSASAISREHLQQRPSIRRARFARRTRARSPRRPRSRLER
jgi:hypothetical protein